MGHVLIVPARVRRVPFVHVELARRLVEAGHEVTFAGNTESRSAAEDAGAIFVELQGLALHEWTPPVGSKAQRLIRLLPELRRRRAHLAEQAARFDAPWAQQLCRDRAPDLVVSDLENMTQMLAARAEGIEVVATTTWPQPFKRRGNPPPHLPIVPGDGLVGTALGIEVAWLRFRLRKVVQAAYTWVRDAGVDLRSIHHHIARSVGLAPRTAFDHGQWMLPMNCDVPTLGLSSASLDLPGPDHPRFVRSIGIVGDPDPARVDDDLAEFLATNAGSDRPLVYVATGSFLDDEAFLRRAIEAVAGRPEWGVVVGLGSRRLEIEVPDHVRLLDFAPQLEVLAAADVAVLHGGSNSIHEAVRLGVPIVSYPYPDFLDQAGNAVRVAVAGVGIVGARSESAAQIADRIASVLGDSAFADHARAKRAEMEAEEAANPIVGLIESFLPTRA
ncbi:MAG: glycosyltransferase [Actinomycetota bacterium]